MVSGDGAVRSANGLGSCGTGGLFASGVEIAPASRALCNPCRAAWRGGGAECRRGGNRYAEHHCASRGSSARALCCPWRSWQAASRGCRRARRPLARQRQRRRRPEPTRRSLELSRLADGPLPRRRELAEAATRYAPLARWLDLGSFGGVYAEPGSDLARERGELPLPAGAAPWTPYGALNPSRGNSTGNGDGMTATCQPKSRSAAGSVAGSTRSSSSTARATSSTSGSTSTRCSASCRAAAGPIRSRSARTIPRSTSGSSTTSCT